ncbi:MAG: bis-aminopropyl spermidine synthase family protein [Nitrososphaeria archaeon]
MSSPDQYLQRMEALIEQHSVNGKTVWKLLKELDPNLHLFIDALNDLYRKGRIKVVDGKIYPVDSQRSSEFELAECEDCHYPGLRMSDSWLEVLRRYNEIVKERPQPDTRFFQGYMLPDDVVKRAAYMNWWGDLYDKDVLILGDDDLLSIALGLTGLPRSITVLDVDERVVEFIERKKGELNTKVDALVYNVKDPLPNELIDRFDVVSSEPLETLSGLRAFVIRATLSLKSGGIAYLGLSRSEANIRKWRYFQGLVHRLGYVISDMRLKFSRYKVDYPTANYEEFLDAFSFKVSRNEGVIWYTSALYRLERIKPAGKLSNQPMKVRLVDPYDDISYPGLSTGNQKGKRNL